MDIASNIEDVIDTLLAENARLKAKVAELEEELAKELRPVFDANGKSIYLVRV